MNDLGGHDPPQYGWETPPAEEQPDVLEQRILKILCKEGKARSSVTLSCDLYSTTEEIEFFRPLEWTLVEALLEDLNKAGMVTYRLGEYGIFTRIRPTAKAYRLLRIHWTWRATVGSDYFRRFERPLHPGDTTDFRSHGDHAKGSEIVREDFIDHCADCDAAHLDLHRDQLKELYGSDEL